MWRVVVPVKQSASLEEHFEIQNGATTVDAALLDTELNDWDRFSVEEAVLLKERHGAEDVEVVVVTVGGESAEEPLLACLAKGADRAIRLWHEAIPLVDPLAVAGILAAVVRREQPELVLCGAQSSDTLSSATGSALAGLLGFPHAAIVRKVDFDRAGQRVVIERELEGGLVEELSMPAPAVLTIQTGINEPRYPNLRAIKQAVEKPLERLAPEDLGIDEAQVAASAGALVVKLSHPEAGKGSAEMLGDDPDIVARRILEILDDALDGRQSA